MSLGRGKCVGNPLQWSLWISIPLHPGNFMMKPVLAVGRYYVGCNDSEANGEEGVGV